MSDYLLTKTAYSLKISEIYATYIANLLSLSYIYIKNDIMISKIYEQPTIEMEVMACEQGFSLSSGFDVPDGENNGDEGWV